MKHMQVKCEEMYNLKPHIIIKRFLRPFDELV